MAPNAKKILVPVKGDGTEEEAFRLACRIAKETKAHLYALYVIEVKQELPLDVEVDPTQAEAILDRLEALGHEERCRIKAEYLQARQAGPAIVQEAQKACVELIVLGIHYRRRFGQFVLGSTTSYVLENAPCPVVLWREKTRKLSLAGS